MVKDRTAEFRSKAGLPQDTSVLIPENEASVPLLEEAATNGTNNSSRDDLLLKILNDIGKVYCDMKDINEKIHKLHVMINQHRKQEFTDQVNEVQQQLYAIITRGIEQFKSKYENITDPFLKHILRTHTRCLTETSQESHLRLCQLMEDARDRQKQYIKKEILITSGYDNNTITDEELEKLLEKPPAVFTQNVLQETNLAKQTLNEIQERHDEFLKLEGRILEVNAMYQDLAVLVSTQSEQIDLIEMNVYEAEAKVEEAKGQTVVARENFFKARRKKICLWCTLIALIIFVIVMLIFSFL